MRNFFALLFVLCTVSVQSQTANNKAAQLGKDKINKVISSMTLEEKAQMLVGGKHEYAIDKVVKDYGKIIPGAAGQTVAIPRLGITATVETDGPAAVRIDPHRDGDNASYYCTGFPIATQLASTWNTDLITEVGQAMGNEVLEYGCDVLLAPSMNIQRNPLCGRDFEYYSEDPVLSGKMGAAMTTGIQSEGVGASIKHFAANNQETCRTENSSDVSQRALREIYLKGFKIAIQEGEPWTIMSSYNKLNGVYTQESYPLLTTLLRDEWGYKGIVMTDWTDPRNTIAQVHAGNDLIMPGKEQQAKEIVDAVHSGKLSMEDVDRNVKRMLEFIMKTPRFKKYNYSNQPDLNAHINVARRAGDEGVVLLKNDDNTLPLKSEKTTVALFGVGSYYLIPGGFGSGSINMCSYVVNVADGLKNAGFTLQPALDSLYQKYFTYQKENLKEKNHDNPWWDLHQRPEEARINEKYIRFRAQESDAAVITFSRISGEGSDNYNSEGNFKLNRTERELLEEVVKKFHAVNKKVIVVLNTGRVLETASWKDLPDAIVLAWQPGQESGNVIADVLDGTVNPSGKLPATFPVDYMDVPSSKNFPYDYDWKGFDENKKDVGHTKYEEGIWVGYRYFNTFDKPVSYPFGYGLSYTTFDYSDASFKKSVNQYTVKVKITNSGKVAGKEVVELYVSAPKGKLEKPACELKAFAKTKLLEPGESEEITLQFNRSDLASFDEENNSWMIDAGEYKILIGASVEDIHQTLLFKINKLITEKVNAIL